MYGWPIMGQMVAIWHKSPYENIHDGMLKWIWFRSVKDALSNPKIMQHRGKELLSRFIWWSIIGDLH